MSRLFTLILLVVAAIAATGAHHGSADYYVDREQVVRGVVTEWRWSSPHTAIVLTATTPEGRAETWEGEGPPLTWASGRGWSSTTLRTGEAVALVMYPSRRRAHAGLVKRIERAHGEVLHVSRPWLDKQSHAQEPGRVQPERAPSAQRYVRAVLVSDATGFVR